MGVIHFGLPLWLVERVVYCRGLVPLCSFWCWRCLCGTCKAGGIGGGRLVVGDSVLDTGGVAVPFNKRVNCCIGGFFLRGRDSHKNYRDPPVSMALLGQCRFPITGDPPPPSFWCRDAPLHQWRFSGSSFRMGCGIEGVCLWTRNCSTVVQERHCGVLYPGLGGGHCLCPRIDTP